METLEPKLLWEYFKQLCAVPHPSGHLDGVRRFILAEAERLGLESEVDAAGNVLVRKPASPGRESAPGIVLEAHMDMVPQADGKVSHDFCKDAIVPRVVDGCVMATHTTLGADNGIGLASMLAVLADAQLQHGPLECLFTVDEETGMTGVRNLRPDWLRGSYMINTDSETEGVVMVGCAGAVDMDATFKYRMDEDVPEGDVAIELSLTGLLGGHSGMDIHLGRGNACKLLFRFLKHAVVNFEARLASVHAGGLRNAIPREAHAVITVPEELVDDMMDEVAYYNDLYRDELRNIDEGVTFKAAVTALPKTLLPEEIQDDLINAVEACHDGVLRFSPDLPGVVETSSNLASVVTSDQETQVIFLIRSLNEEMKRALASRLQSLFLLAGARVTFNAAYPGWELNPKSPLLALARQKYAELFGQDVKVDMVHCGLECGIITDQYPKLDIISFGPTIHSPHSPNERVEIESVARYWRFLTSLLA